MTTPTAISTATIPAGSQPANGNTFQFVNHSVHTKVSYNLESNGPPRAGQPSGGPSLSYTGPEGNFAFSGDQIMQNDTPMGSVVSVTLTQERDANGTIFSLLVPPVVVGEGSTQHFTTYAVKSHRPGNAQNPGALITYETERLQGSAEFVRIHAF